MVPQTIITIDTNYNNLDDIISINIVLRLLINAYELIYTYNHAL